MVDKRFFLAAALLLACLSSARGAEPNRYPWTEPLAAGAERPADIEKRIPPPAGFERVGVEAGSFDDWLRHLPLKADGAPVQLFDGRKKADQAVHAAVIDIDTGGRDLQQCADAVIRLRAEYLFSRGKSDAIVFHFTSGDAARYADWRKGLRPEVSGNKVRWARKAAPDDTHASFRKYLDTVFAYAGTQSLERELEKREKVAEMRIGDVFIRGGSPGHAAIVVDMASRKGPDGSDELVFLLAQGYMPAQDIHVLKNPNDRALSPWYPVGFGDKLRTPEWEFVRTELRSFAEERR